MDGSLIIQSFTAVGVGYLILRSLSDTALQRILDCCAFIELILFVFLTVPLIELFFAVPKPKSTFAFWFSVSAASSERFNSVERFFLFEPMLVTVPVLMVSVLVFTFVAWMVNQNKLK